MPIRGESRSGRGASRGSGARKREHPVVTVASLAVSSGSVAVRYDEASGVVGTGGVVLAATSRLAAGQDQATSGMDTSDSSMDTTNGGGSSAGGVVGVGGTIASVVAGAASLTLVKAETPEHLAGTSTAAVPGSVAAATGALFPGIAAAAAAAKGGARSDDWLAANSPGSPPATLQAQHVVYANPQQQLAATESQQQPPLAHSSPLAHQQQQPNNSNNGYASPMSTSSYDPYSPNSKIGKWNDRRVSFVLVVYERERDRPSKVRRMKRNRVRARACKYPGEEARGGGEVR